MTFEADQIVARRRLRRQVSFWRAGAIVVAVMMIQTPIREMRAEFENAVMQAIVK